MASSGRPARPYLADRRRHLWCPGGRAALLAMADDLGIRHGWLHRGGALEHIDVPLRDVDRVLADPRVRVMQSPRALLERAKKVTLQP